ncbi:hypothetical protein Tco_0528434 [Tanacetum coccineum]
MITQPTDIPSGNNTEVSRSITESLVPDVPQSHISNQASTSSHPVPLDRCSRGQYIELVNIIGDPGEGMLTRSMAAKLTAASASECLFVDFLSEIEPKKVFRNKKDEHDIHKELKEDGCTRFLVGRKELSMMKPCKTPSGQGWKPQDIPCLCHIYELQILPNGGQKCLLEGVKRSQSRPEDEYSNPCEIARLVLVQIMGGKILVCWSAKKQQSVAMSSPRLNMLQLLGVVQVSYG